jgi:hypothetical protein
VRGRKVFFFEKKKQKTFVRAVANLMEKSFLVLFFKKELLAVFRFRRGGWRERPGL